VAQSNIYAQKENGDLKLIAEIEGLSDPALAVDALLDEMPRMQQREFIVLDMDYVTLVEVPDDEIVQPRRRIVVSSGNNVAPVAEPEQIEDESEAPAPSKPAKRRGRARGAAAKPAKRRASKPAKRRGGGGAFRKNPSSAD
jgi:hypothetical protein